MSISRRNNRALNRVLRDSLRARERSEPAPKAEAPKPAAPAYTLCADIPECYNDSYVRAIPKDPQNTFVYWELPKSEADGSLFADKGTAHVGNAEAVRIGEQLNEKQRQRQAENGGREDNARKQESRQDNYRYADTDYGRINWDNGNHYSFDGGGQQYYHCADNYHQVNWDNGNHYSFGGGGQQHWHCADNYHQVNWDNGNHYSFDGGGQQHWHCADNYHQVNWDNGNRYRFDGGGQQHCHNADNYHQINWDDGCGQINWSGDGNRRLLRYRDGIYRFILNNGGGGPRRDGGDGSAFSKMLSALIERCNRYIADYSRCGSDTLARAMSSGLLCGTSGEALT